MELMKNMIKAACFISVAIMIADMIKPSEKFDKQLKMIFSLVLIIGMLTPILSGKFDLSFADDIGVNTDVDYEDEEDTLNSSLKKSVESNIEHSLKVSLAQNGILCEKISISVNISEDSSISINEVRIACNNIARARTIISEQLSVDEKCIKETEKN